MKYAYVSSLRCCLLSMLLLSTHVFAAAIHVQVTDESGNPVPNAAVYAEATSNQPSALASSASVEIEQKNRKFSPLVTVIQTGTSVSLPNNDTVRHHVYSFSPAKTFELKLYAGVPSTPILFDKPGTVVLGCNIHDKMVAYIHVVNTPYFSKTDDSGKTKLDGINAGKYVLKVWHFKLPSGEPIPHQTIDVTEKDTTVNIKLNIKSPPAPPHHDAGYTG